MASTVEHAEPTRNFRMSTASHTRLRALSEAESRTMTAQLDLIIGDWMATNGYVVRNGKIKHEKVSAAS